MTVAPRFLPPGGPDQGGWGSATWAAICLPAFSIHGLGVWVCGMVTHPGPDLVFVVNHLAIIRVRYGIRLRPIAETGRDILRERDERSGSTPAITRCKG